MFTPSMTWFVAWVGVLVLLVFAAITGYLEGSGHRILPRPSRPRLPRRDRRMPKLTATVWGATRRADPPGADRRPGPTCPGPPDRCRATCGPARVHACH